MLNRININKFNIIFSLFSIIIGLMIIIHMLHPEMMIDAITIALIIISIFPWFFPHLKTLEFSGVKVEFRDLVKAGEKVEMAGLVAKEGKKRDSDIDPLLNINDPNLALAWVRIEIEKKLRKIASASGLDVERMSISRILRVLGSENIFSNEQINSILELTQVLNNAVHGVDVDYRAATWAIDTGQMIIKALDERLNQISEIHMQKAPQ